MTTSNNVLSLGNILQHFPEFLIKVLPYIADRAVFNSIASCNKDTNEKSKAILPPWPKYYQLPASSGYSIAVWSQDGTRVAYSRGFLADGTRVPYTVDRDILIVHQQHGIIYRIYNSNINGVTVSDLKFSPDGRFLVSVDDDTIVTAWDINVAGNYEQLGGNADQLQMWNMKEDFGEYGCSIDISACSTYIVIASDMHISNRVVVKSVENGGTVRSLTVPQSVMDGLFEVMFSMDCRAVFLCGFVGNSNIIKLWRSYLDDADEDSLITLWEEEKCYDTTTVFSHDKTMIVIHDISLKKGWLLSIDKNYSCSTQQFTVEDLFFPLQFTLDDKYIIYETHHNHDLKYWSVVKKKFINNTTCLSDTTMNGLGLRAVVCSPNNRQLIVWSDNKEGDSPPIYIMSIF